MASEQETREKITWKIIKKITQEINDNMDLIINCQPREIISIDNEEIILTKFEEDCYLAFLGDHFQSSSMTTSEILEFVFESEDKEDTYYNPKVKLIPEQDIDELSARIRVLDRINLDLFYDKKFTWKNRSCCGNSIHENTITYSRIDNSISVHCGTGMRDIFYMKNILS